MLQLIGYMDSPFVRRVAITMQFLGIAYNHRELSIFRDYDEFRAINPMVKVPTLVLEDGQVLIDSGRYSKAASIWKYLTRGKGSEGDFYMELGKAALLAGNLNEAVRAFDWFLLLNPDDPEVLFQLGITYIRMHI